MDKRGPGYEPENLDTTPALVGGLVLAILCFVTMAICAWLFGSLEEKVAQNDEVLSPLIAGRVLPPHPRLQTTPNSDIAALRIREERLLNSYSWVDKPGGVARIPISRAIEIVAKIGLPSAPPPVEVKPAEVTPAEVDDAVADGEEPPKEAAE